MANTQTVKVAVFRQAYDHLFRIANVDYHACVGAGEVENWKRSAARMLSEYELYHCGRAQAYDLEQFAKAVEAVRVCLVSADDRIKKYAAESSERRSAPNVQKQVTTLHKSGLVSAVIPFPYRFT